MTSSETTFNDEELIAKLRGEPTWGGIVVLTKQDANRIEALIAERERDHANINLKADFIDKTLNQLAEAEAKLAQAVEAFDMLVRDCEADYPPSHGAIKHFAIATLAEINGESHDRA